MLCLLKATKQMKFCKFKLENVCRKFSSQVDERQAKLMAKGLPKRQTLTDVTDIVVIASGKGGVGKSTTSVNVAIALSQMGKKVGLLDADIFGPTVPLLMNLHESPLINAQKLMIPLQNYGIKCLSMGFLMDPNKPVIWRGPLVMSAVERLLKGAAWGPLDVLIVDTPPGTGDVHLSLSQQVPLSGVILISTPERAALEVVKRGAKMYETLQIPIIGLVENMSHTYCTNCKEKIQIYPPLTDKYLKELNIDVLETIPISPILAECSNEGTPIVIKSPESNYASIYGSIAIKIVKFLCDNKNKNELQQ